MVRKMVPIKPGTAIKNLVPEPEHKGFKVPFRSNQGKPGSNGTNDYWPQFLEQT